MDKADSLQDQIGDFSREIETKRKYRTKMLEIKDTVIELKSTFDELINTEGENK